MPDSCTATHDDVSGFALTVCECQDCERKRSTETVRIAKDGCTGQPSCACDICRWARRNALAAGFAKRPQIVRQTQSGAHELTCTCDICSWQREIEAADDTDMRATDIDYHSYKARERAAIAAIQDDPGHFMHPFFPKPTLGRWNRFRRWLAQVLRGLARGQRQREG